MLNKLSTVALLLVGSALAIRNYDSFDVTLTSSTNVDHTFPLHVYYPTKVSPPWNVAVFLHGFECPAKYYDWVYQYLAPLGYIVAMPDSYPRGSPNNTQFAMDQRYSLEWLRNDANSDSSSPLYGNVGDKALAMGHSEGGGASVTSPSDQFNAEFPVYQSTFDAVFVMAPCGKSGATQYAKTTYLPTMVMSGSSDCICPSVDAVKLIYGNLGAECKMLADATNGTHCHWMNPNLAADDLCTQGEAEMCQILHPGQDMGGLAESVQLAMAEQYLELWLKATIVDGGSAADYATVVDTLNQDLDNGVMVQVNGGHCG